MTHKTHLLYKSIILRLITIGIRLLLINLKTLTNLSIVTNYDWKRIIIINLIFIVCAIILNIADFIISNQLINSYSKFARWIFINKFVSWQTKKFGKYLAISKNNIF